MRSVDENELIELERKFLWTVKEGVDAENQARDSSNGKVTADAKRIGLRHAIPMPHNETLAAAAGKAIRELGLGEPVFEPGSTDSNAASSANKPAITIGGGGLGANFHSLQEWYEPKDAYRGIQAALLTVLNYDSPDPSAK
jgi:acetylornithine deacetylase/succinyl-diaminopimelate desuccinylase-like protein